MQCKWHLIRHEYFRFHYFHVTLDGVKVVNEGWQSMILRMRREAVWLWAMEAFKYKQVFVELNQKCSHHQENLGSNAIQKYNKLDLFH